MSFLRLYFYLHLFACYLLYFTPCLSTCCQHFTGRQITSLPWPLWTLFADLTSSACSTFVIYYFETFQCAFGYSYLLSCRFCCSTLSRQTVLLNQPHHCLIQLDPNIHPGISQPNSQGRMMGRIHIWFFLNQFTMYKYIHTVAVKTAGWLRCSNTEKMREDFREHPWFVV